ncbi:MAG: LPP20 family lipoprotein [Kiritimatiellaceae bacterium]|nr:LPP20 family lipoprotein [Kiritimatiellaceae bacterium]
MNTNRCKLRVAQAIRVCLCVSALLISGCKTLTGGTPEWLVNPKAVYPEKVYLAAVGAGDTRRAAENAAAANLSRIFEAHIESNERLLDQSHENNEEIIRTVDFTADINILSSQVLFNVQHAEAWKDDTGRIHAVAYIDRRETAAIYRDKIAEQTARIHFLSAHADTAKDLLTKYANLRAAMQHVMENKILLRQLKVIHPPSIPEATPDYIENNIRKSLADTAKKNRVEINIEGDDNKRMTAVVEELITRYGFVVGTPAVLQIEGRISVNDTGLQAHDLVFVRYSLFMQIKDAKETVLISIREQGREAHTSPKEARIRSFRTIESAIQSGGAKRLDSYFDSLTDQTPL